jgi:hypothetical protein
MFFLTLLAIGADQKAGLSGHCLFCRRGFFETAFCLYFGFWEESLRLYLH